MEAKVINVAYEAVVTETADDGFSEPLHGITNHVANRIFVTNFDKQTTEDDLRQAFQRTGEIIDVNIIRNAPHGRCYGFVTFRSRHDCAKLLLMKDRLTLIIRDREIVFSQARFMPRRNNKPQTMDEKELENVIRPLPSATLHRESPPNGIHSEVMNGTTYYSQPMNVTHHAVAFDQLLPNFVISASSPSNIPVYQPTLYSTALWEATQQIGSNAMYFYQ